MTDHAPLLVPSATFEVHTWQAENDGMSSRAQIAAGSGSYRSAVTPRIATLELVIPGNLAADVEEAAAELAGFDTHAQSVLGAHNSTLGPMSSILLRTESTSSSQIENLTVGARQLALAELDQSTSENAKTVVANVRAMEAALSLANSLDSDAILTMHAELMSGQRGWERHAGKYRQNLVWVGTSSISPRGATHIAPQATHVQGAVDDVVAFIARDDIPVIVQAAIAHAQFETIHPFADGNGRTGRALVQAIIRGKRLVTTTTAPVSAGLLRDTEAYFDALTTYRQGNARPIVERFAAAARFAASSGRQLVDDLAEQLDISRQHMSALRPQATAWTILPHLVAHPVINAHFLTDHLGMNPVTAHRALAALTETGVIVERTGLRRNRVWQHPGILSVLDVYAQQLRRR